MTRVGTPMREGIPAVEKDGKLRAVSTRNTCDKCFQRVEPGNDAVMIDMLMSSDPGIIGLVTAWPRHLLPTEDCPGSPSRAQYLPDMPKDPRYPYSDDLEPRVRAAYARMQELANR